MFIDEKTELNFYRQVFNKMNAAIYTVNMDPYAIEWINQSRIISDVLGISRDEVLAQGQYIAAQLLANPDFSESVTLAVEKFKEKPDIAWAGVYRIKHINGNYNWVVYATSTLESDENGVPVKAVCIAIDPSNLLNTPETLKHFIKHLNQLRFQPLIKTLTGRQKEIFELLLDSHSEEDIADKIGISKYTVRDHKKSLYKKLSCKNSKELFARAQSAGMI
jgi:DNA-binding CsgD family transcriptional regulator